MKIGFVLFENYHQRKNIGSSRIRGHWIMKYLNRIKGIEAEEFIQGKNYDVIVFQKVYWKEMARAFEGIKILDICDPDWLDGAEMAEFLGNMDAVTCSTENLKKDIEQMCKCPVYYVPDGEDLELLPPPKKHQGKAKKCVWFGYSNNMEILEQTFQKIKSLDLTLKVISDGIFNTRECKVENVKWDIETESKEIQDCDFALLPEKLSMRFQYKSPNKTVHCWSLGIPVAKTPQDMDLFMDGEERQRESDLKYKEAIENNSVAKSASLLFNIIDSIKK
jgi:hypothetical protein